MAVASLPWQHAAGADLMNSETHANLLVPKPFTILGLTLKPFCVGHKVLLQRVESPIECGGDIDGGDVALAVMLCSLDYETGKQAIDTANIQSDVRRWIKKLISPLPWKRNKIDWPEKFALFNEYVGYHSRSYSFNGISYGNSNQQTAPSETPNIHGLIVALMRMMHLSESQVMNRCYGLALCDYAVCLEQEGRVIVRDKEKMEEVRRDLEEFVKAL